ncbi:hypothetical protein HFO15_13530 [Rhizobium laguerreae]|nr:hypothetical protein [Rhizobium laguerreae]MBY3262665.1 hypothetical protein [Rhizobium laguerreae]MBY3338300.1 hypothetical protein [Rhizobium laguerreae]MBY3412773.1 hypothetical protein [Rhizobium laguerreae]
MGEKNSNRQQKQTAQFRFGLKLITHRISRALELPDIEPLRSGFLS